MKKRSDLPSSRCLRLERLENRSLLAGGLLPVGLVERTGGDNGVDQFDRSDSHRRDRNQRTPAEVRGQSGQRTNFDRQNDSRQSAEDRQQPQGTPSVLLSLAPSNVVITFPSSQFVEPPQQPSTVNLPGDRPPVATLDAAFAAITNASNDTTDETNSNLTSKLAANVSTIEAADTRQRVSSPQPWTNSADTTLDVFTLQSSDSSDTVDLTPLLQTQPFQSSDIQDEEPWKLDSRILPRLKQAIDVSPDELAKFADKVVTEWFGGPGGLVAVDHVHLPSRLFMLDNAVVDIHLESNLLLYRSLEFVATTAPTQIALPVSGPISDQALDAIVTTLGMLADNEVQPIAESPTFKLSTIVYPAIVVATTGVIISSRRKIRHRKPYATNNAGV